VALPNILSCLVNNYDRKLRVSFTALYCFYILVYIIIYLKYRMIWHSWFRNLKWAKCNKQPDKESKNYTTTTMIMLMIGSSNFVFLLRSCGNYRKHIFRKRWWVFDYEKSTSLKKEMPLKRLKLNHMEYYAYTYLSLYKMNFKRAVLWAGVGQVAHSV